MQSQVQLQITASKSRNFLKPLVNPEGAQIDESVVAVHGLNATDDEDIAYSAWTASNGKMWLRDFLPAQLPHARILLFGYNSNVAFEASTAGIHAHAGNLLNLLKMRRKDSVDRPIIFICYSLGGIIVKEALILAKLDDTYLTIRRSSYGIVFFGTPHQGGCFQSLGNIAASIASLTLQNPRNDLIETLRKESLLNEQKSQYFRHQLEDYRVITFYETLGVGDLGPIVDQKSANLGLSGTREKQIALDADHANLCKFQQCDDEYEMVVGNIYELVDQALLGDVLAGSQVVAQTRVFKVPDLLHRHFTGRVEQLQKLYDMLEKLPQDSASKRVAIFGMPGVGKSQIALKFAHQKKNLYTSVFYVQATDRERIISDFEIIHGLLHPNSTEQNQNQKIQHVIQWLVNNSSWLLLLDNVVHVDDVQGFLPASGTGAIIFTMRSELAAQELGLAGRLELSHMNETEGVNLIMEISEITSPTEEQETLAIELHRELGGLPLALEQVVTSLNHRRWSMGKSLRQLRSGKIDALKMMPENRAKANCYSVFHLAIQNVKPTAIMLLKIISHLDHQNVPQELFGRGRAALLDFLTHPKYLIKQRNPAKLLKCLFSDIEEIESAIYALQMAALVRRSGEGNIWMHDLFRDLSSDLISASERKFLAIAMVVFTSGALLDHTSDSKTQKLYKTLAPHAINSIQQAQLQKVKSLLLYGAANHLGSIFFSRGRYTDAQEWYHRALERSEKIRGKKHPNTLNMVCNVAAALGKQGEYDKALEWYHRALEGMEKALGKEHPNTLRSIHGIASVFRNQGEYDKALEWYHRALEGREKVLGKEDPGTLWSVYGIASVFRDQGEYDKALEWYHRALEGREKALGKEHPDTLCSVRGIASVFRDQGEYDKALEWYHRALEGMEKALGKEHPHTLWSVHGIASVFRDQGEYDKAFEWYHRALEGMEKVLGKEHPNTLKTARAITALPHDRGVQ